MNRCVLFPRHLGGVLVIILSSGLLAPAHAAATHHEHGLSVAPAALVAAIARTQANDAAKNPAYAIANNGCASLNTGPKSAPLTGCFTHTGPAFAQGNNQIDLHLTAWGRTHRLQPVSLQRTAPTANRIEYRAKHIREWWRVLPMGYEQGFTLDHAPAGHGEVILQLRASRTPTIEHDTLTWGNLHYGKLRVVDADGKALASHLSVHGKTITLAFDAHKARFPVTVDPLVWLQQTLADPGTGADYFGQAVALDAAGDIALVGADTANAAYIYTLRRGSWTQAARLTASYSGELGWSVALNSTGSIALVGAPYNAGAAYVYNEPPGGWANNRSPAPAATLTASGSYELGWSVALDSAGTTALVGAPYPYTNSHTGAAFVYTESTSAGWSGSISTPAATLTGNSSNDRFGSSVALSANGANALVGAPYTSMGRNISAGAAYFYTEPASGGWSGTISLPSFTQLDPGGAPMDQFGTSVALDGSGTTALVGSIGRDMAYIYTLSGNTWTETAMLTASGSAAFGSSVALDNSGTTALVGAPGMGTGTAYVYNQPTSGGWGSAPAPSAALMASGSFELGWSAALDSTGTTALVGAPFMNSNTGAAYAFTLSSLSAVLNVPASVLPSTQYGADYIVTNNGSAPSADVQVHMPVPAGATYVRASAIPAGSCTYDGTTGVATCDLGAIAGDTMATAVLTLKSGATSGTITQTADLVNGTPNLAQTASTSVATVSFHSGPGGLGGEILGRLSGARRRGQRAAGRTP